MCGLLGVRVESVALQLRPTVEESGGMQSIISYLCQNPDQVVALAMYNMSIYITLSSCGLAMYNMNIYITLSRCGPCYV